LVDIDSDGCNDLITGSWPGELFLFRGRPDHTFGPREKIKDKEGEEINVGGGVRTQPDGMILITGDAKWETTPEGTTVVYKGKKYKSTAEKPVASTGCASVVHAVDWDSDGDLDLLVGDISGAVHLIPNEGNAKAYAFGKAQPLEAAGKPLRVEGDAGPFTADWDGDGKRDLLVGSGDGSVSFFRNSGTPKAPVLSSAVVLVSPGEASFGPLAPKKPTRGIRSKICVADWNGDGRLDLLVGDFAVQAPDLPEPTAEQKKQYAELRKQLDELQTEYRNNIFKIHGPKRLKNQAELDKARNAMSEISKKMSALREKLPAEYDNHGWIWLFLREPTGATPRNEARK
jgi:FG-GAP-like repeat